MTDLPKIPRAVRVELGRAVRGRLGALRQRRDELSKAGLPKGLPEAIDAAAAAQQWLDDLERRLAERERVLSLAAMRGARASLEVGGA